jgi:OPT family oligopeptide transporter
MSSSPAPNDPKGFQPFVPASESPPEFTLAPILTGTLLGIVFGASSMYLVLKVGLTVSASIPVAVLAFAVFRGLSKAFGLRQRSPLENNIVQTAGSAGESIAFGVGLVMPALLLIGFDIDAVRVMVVGVFGALLGILMMIPLRRVFIVQKHGELKYPEGTACAEVLIAGEKGGATAGLLFAGFGIGFVVAALQKIFKVIQEETHHALDKIGLKGGAVGGEWTAPLLGVGYIIGPRIAGIMVAGGVLAYLVIAPTLVYFGEHLTEPLSPAQHTIKVDDHTAAVTGFAATAVDHGLIKNMDGGEIRTNYILYIGAGAVAAGGIISMLKALPVIVGSIGSAFRDLTGGSGGRATRLRTDRDMPMTVVLFGSLGLVVALAVTPTLGLGLNLAGVVGAVMIVVFGFLFVTVSARLTGEIGSTSNPISGMTVATLLLVCLILLALGESGVVSLGKGTKLLALTIAGVVCIACSNGGTTAQALKTGHLLGSTPIWQQYAILIASLMSALVVGLVLLAMNQAGTIYSKKNLPTATVDVSQLAARDRVRTGPYAEQDATEYAVLVVAEKEMEGVPGGRYLIDSAGKFAYVCDPAVNGKLKAEDNGESKEGSKFSAPKTQLVAFIINGLFDKNLPWGLVMIGVLIAVTLELSGVPSLPFAVGVYLPLASSVPIFLGGMVRWAVDLFRKQPDEGDSGPGVLLSSGYIAGGSIAAVIAAFLAFAPSTLKSLSLTKSLPEAVTGDSASLAVFAGMMVTLFWIGWRHGKK